MSIFGHKEPDGTLNVRVCGYVTRDPKVFEKVVLFSVCYGKKKYMDVKAWTSGKCGELAACLEAHDEVAVDGVFETYKDKEGKERAQVVADFITVLMEAPEGDEGNGEDGGAEASEGDNGFGEAMEDADGELPF